MRNGTGTRVLSSIPRPSGMLRVLDGSWTDSTGLFTHVLISDGAIRADGCVIIGVVLNTAAADGATEVDGGATVYGDITSPGRVVLGGGSEPPSGGVVYGRVWAGDIELRGDGEIRDFDDVSEPEAGFDLDFDGDATNLFVNKAAGTLSAVRTAVSDGIALSDGDTDFRVSRGVTHIQIGGPPPASAARPVPDIAAFFALAAGSNAYPPGAAHVTSEIPGDGDGHYFESSDAFIDWLHDRYPASAACWRCGGDGRTGPDDDVPCPGCEATGRQPAVDIAGVFYIDDDVLDLGEVGTNLIVHGTIVVAEGDPHGWPTLDDRAATTAVRFPTHGSLVIEGPARMHLTQTYRSSTEGDTYLRYRRAVGPNRDEQMIPLPGPDRGRPLREFPGILAASTIEIGPRGVGFAAYRADIGDETMTILQGALFAGDRVRLDARGGWPGEPIVFDEEVTRADEDAFQESVLDIDLNGDGDRLDTVETIDITTRPVVPLSNGESSVDINNDGVLGKVVIGSSYRGFFLENGNRVPVLIFHQGLVLSRVIELTGSSVITFDPGVSEAGTPFGFDRESTAAPPGLATRRTIPRR
ncbi:MAG: hypothetical protein P8181_11150 [bacterium]